MKDCLQAYQFTGNSLHPFIRVSYVKQGGENCLEGLTFVITGVLESFERDEAKSVVEKYGGKVTGNVSKKTDYLVAGRDAGEKKIEKVNITL